jgi:hypothetical protein
MVRVHTKFNSFFCCTRANHRLFLFVTVGIPGRISDRGMPDFCVAPTLRGGRIARSGRRRACGRLKIPDIRRHVMRL